MTDGENIKRCEGKNLKVRKGKRKNCIKNSAKRYKNKTHISWVINSSRLPCECSLEIENYRNEQFLLCVQEVVPKFV